ncbi:MAG: metallophosphoesterase [Kamptonema sp. SIO1D9]|nr:metallophosphoesterase [Kamptonema sp. SIO1D9]
MKIVSDPPIATKLCKMKQRVRWEDPLISDRQIDQTSFVLDDGFSDRQEFSFLVIGDSGTGYHRSHNPQRQVAEMLLEHQSRCRFLLHTGDVVYLVGSSEYYPANFIHPYREFIVGGEKPDKIHYDRMVFKLPILPVPGNHDYYDLPLISGVLAQATWPLRRLLRTKMSFDIGWHGSHQGRTYAKAFLDYLQKIDNPNELGRHLDTYYTAKTNTGRCLRYQPGLFTRLPNRYYTFRYGGVDFFALDSNTFNAPIPIPATKEGESLRRQLIRRLAELERKKEQIMEISAQLNSSNPDEAEQLDDYEGKLEQIEEMKLDIEKQLAADEKSVIDWEQLNWLKQRLIASWQDEQVRGRVIYLHHPPYVTEATKWNQAQTKSIRFHLRWVLDGVASAVGELAAGRPLVDLVISGHAHCLEHLRTENTGHGDSNINWLVCGGSGYSLRRQRKQGTDILETEENLLVARSLLFYGRHDQGKHKRRFYSALRIDVQPGQPVKFSVQPLILERFRHEWHQPQAEPFLL